MTENFSDQQLQSYLDETLPCETLAAIEQQLRTDEVLRERLVATAGLREAGVHSLGEMWRRHRLSCLTRQQLGNYLLGVMEADLHDYTRFHLEQVQCRYCRANLDDLERQKTEQQSTAQSRRQRYFQTSAGFLSRGKP